MKKLLTLFILFSAHFLLQAQPISGVPDPGFFPQDIGRIFDEEHKLYQTVTRFYRGWDGGLFVYSQHQRFLQGQGNLMLQSFTPLDKDLEHPKFAFCDRNQRFSYENRALYDYRGSKGVAQSESGFYWNFGVQNDSIYIDTISPVTVWREFRVTRSKFKIGRPFTGGAMPIGAHDEAPYLKRFWLSVDPVFYPQGEASWIVQTRGNRNWINRIFRSNHLSIQKSCVFANGDMYGACAFREGGIRSLKMVKWDTLIVPRDSFLIANSAGFTKVHLMQRDAQNRITLAFETFSGGQYSERIVRYLLNGNLDPTFQQIVLQNATPLHTHFLDNQLLVTRQTSSQLVVSRYSIDGIFISFKNFYLYENHIAHRPILNFDDGQKILFESVHPVDTRLGEEYPDNIYDSTYTVSNRFILDLQSGWQPLLKDIVAVPKNRVFDVPSIQLRKSRLANRLVYSGMFSHIFGRLSPNYAVLNPNGTLDTTYIDLTRMSKAVRDTIFKR